MVPRHAKMSRYLLQLYFYRIMPHYCLGVCVFFGLSFFLCCYFWHRTTSYGLIDVRWYCNRGRIFIGIECVQNQTARWLKLVLQKPQTATFQSDSRDLFGLTWSIPSDSCDLSRRINETCSVGFTWPVPNFTCNLQP